MAFKSRLKCLFLKPIFCILFATFLHFVRNTTGIEKVNIGNYGRAEKEHDGYIRKPYGQNLYIDDIELPIFKEIANMHENVFYQTMPEDMVMELNKIVSC